MTEADDKAPAVEAAKRRRRTISVVLIALAAVSFGATAWWRCTHRTEPVDVKWRCEPAGPGYRCSFLAERAVPGLCFDMVVQCGDVTHRAGEICSPVLEAGEPSVFVHVGEFEPPLPADRAGCGKPTYENRRERGR